MATIYNSQLSKELQNGAKLQIRDKMPTELAEKVVPVMEVNPKLLRRCDIVSGTSGTTTGSITLYTTPATQDFYLCGLQYFVYQDAASDGTTMTVRAVINGATVYLAYIRKPTLTAFQNSDYIAFPFPIKIDRNTAITIVDSFTVGVATKAGSVIGYIDEQSRA